MIEDILKELMEEAYWYGERTGDYKMDHVEEEEFFKKALIKIKEAAK